MGAPDLRHLALTSLPMEVVGEGDHGSLKIRIVLQGLLTGACPRLETLYLSCKDHLGDDEVVELARALEGGAHCNLTLRKLFLLSLISALVV